MWRSVWRRNTTAPRVTMSARSFGKTKSNAMRRNWSKCCLKGCGQDGEWRLARKSGRSFGKSLRLGCIPNNQKQGYEAMASIHTTAGQGGEERHLALFLPSRAPWVAHLAAPEI